MDCCNNKKTIPSSAINESDSLTINIDKIFKDWNSVDSPGGSIAIVKEGRVIFIKGYGSSDLEISSPITSDTKFNLGSISKQFTGYCIAKLIYDGKLSLDDNIKKYFPEFSLNSTIRVRDLVYQKSGLRDFLGLIPLMGYSIKDYFTNNTILNILQNQKDLNFQPGEKWEYSNTNYFLLGEIVRRVTNSSLKEWAKKNIFIPLKMYNTFFVDSVETIVTNRAKSYHQNNNGNFSNDPFLDVTVGHSGLYSTAEDMAKWLIYLRTMYMEEYPVFKLMLQNDTLNSGRELANYSFGLFKSYANTLEYWHRGSFFGYKSIIAYYPEKDYGLVILSNVQRFNRIRFEKEITQTFFPELNSSPIKSQTVFSLEDSLKHRKVPLEPGLLKKFEGYYVVAPMEIYVITRRGNALSLYEYTGSDTTNLVYIGKNMFRNDEGTILLSFYKDHEGSFDSLAFQSASDSLTGIRTRLLSPSRETEKVGEYYNGELDISIKISKTTTGLAAGNRKLGIMDLIPTYKDEFRCDDDFFSYIKFSRDKNNSINGFLLDGFSVSNIRFIKK